MRITTWLIACAIGFSVFGQGWADDEMGLTPVGLAPGSPAGSYVLSGVSIF